MSPDPRARPRYFVDIAITSDGVRTRYDSLATEFQIVRGVGDYVFFNQAPDVGQLIMKSRNKALDPILNPTIKANSTIELYATKRDKSQDYPIFTGKVTSVEVDYLPNGEKPEIKVNAIDALGLLAEHNFTPEFAARPDVLGIELTLEQLCDLLIHDIPDINIDYVNNNFQSGNGHTGAALVAEDILGKPSAKTYIQAGDNAYDVVSKLAQADLMEMVCDAENKITIQTYYRHNPLYWDYASRIAQRAEWFLDPQLWNPNAPERPPIPTMTFTEDKTHEFPYLGVTGGNSFIDIAATDGYGRTVNSVIFSNKTVTYDPVEQEYSETSTEYGPYEDAASIAQYGQKRIIIDTIRNDDGNLDSYYQLLATEILNEAAYPAPTVNKIKSKTLLDAFYENYDNYHWIDPMKTSFEYLQIYVTRGTNRNYPLGAQFAKKIDKTVVGVYFEPDPTDPASAIDRDYEVVGVTHYITPENWETELTFSIESKETKLIKNLAIKNIGSIQSRLSSSDDYYNRVMEWDASRQLPGNVGNVFYAENEDFDDVTNWYWVFGPNDTNAVVHWNGDWHRQDIIGGGYLPERPEVQYWSGPAPYDPINPTNPAINGVQIFPNDDIDWKGPGIKKPLLVYKDINGWYYLHILGAYNVAAAP